MSRRAPAVTVLNPGANNGNGDIFIRPGAGSVSGPEIISNTGKALAASGAVRVPVTYRCTGHPWSDTSEFVYPDGDRIVRAPR